MSNPDWCRDQENRYIDSTAANYPNSLHGGAKHSGKSTKKDWIDKAINDLFPEKL